MEDKYRKNKVAHQIWTEADLWRRFRSKLILEGITASKKIRTWIEEYVYGGKE